MISSKLLCVDRGIKEMRRETKMEGDDKANLFSEVMDIKLPRSLALSRESREVLLFEECICAAFLDK